MKDFFSAMEAHGLRPPAAMEPGRFYRFPGEGKGGSNTAGWAMSFPDGLGGSFGDFSSDLSVTWQANSDREYTPEERAAFKRQVAEAKRQAETERQARQEEAAKRAMEILKAATGDPVSHPYVVKKQVPTGRFVKRGRWPQRGWDDALLIPFYDSSRKVSTVQAINGDGTKDLLAGGKKKGCFFPFGNIREATSILIGEGLATVAAGVNATGFPGVVAIDAGNLLEVSRVVREIAPGAEITLLADDDLGGDNNLGVETALVAARAINGKVAFPDLGKKADFGDLWSEQGADAVAAAIKEAIVSPSSGIFPEQAKDKEDIPDPVFLEDNSTTEIAADFFPPTIAEMIKATSAATETPIELPALMALAALATCNQQKFRVMAEQDYYEPLNLWAVVALDPGNRKSAVAKTTTKPLLDWDIEQAEAAQATIRRLSEDRENKIARIKMLRGAYAKSEIAGLGEIEDEILKITESLPEVPAIPRVWTQDITPEKLGDIMAEQGEKMSILSSEGGVFDTIGGRYSNGIPNLDIYLQAHAGDPVRVDRQSRPAIFMRNPTLSMGLSPQPDVLHGLSSKPGFRGRGLLARFLYALPHSPIGNRDLNPVPIPEATKSRYHNTLTALLSISPGTDDKGITIPFTLTLTDEARREWKDFAMVVERDMRGGGRFENITDWASKLPGAALRIAGNFHCALNAYHQPASLPINKDTMNDALQLSAILAEHALIVFGYMGADKSLAAAKKVWSWVERNRFDQFSARDCFRALSGTYKRMDEIRPAFSVLTERHYIFEQEKDDKPGRPSMIFTVHPKIVEDWI